jgi:hypothetical protein
LDLISVLKILRDECNCLNRRDGVQHRENPDLGFGSICRMRSLLVAWAT